MARTSNREQRRKQKSDTLVPADGKKIYRTVIYVRLSVEDERKIANNTVENQIALLKEYVEKADDMMFAGRYCDRGITGTRFDRPDFQRLISDMKQGKFDCIVVKDLSRLGRNYLEAGEYLEKIFPLYGIRFVSVSDGFDTLYSKPMEDGMIVPLKNLINEAYAKDISKRVAVSKENQQRRGEFIGKQPPYGYIKDPKDCHHLIPDENVKQIVIDMFSWRASGKSVVEIARKLNGLNLLAPVAYRIQQGMEKNPKYKDVKWDAEVVTCILRNPVYIGDMEQGYQKGALYKGMPVHRQKKEQRIYVENTHEPIVDKKIFWKVQELLEQVRKRHNSVRLKYKDIERREDIFRGLLYCADCECKLTFYRRTVKLSSGYHHYYTYLCHNTPYREECVKKNFKMEKPEQIVIELINTHIQLYLDKEALLQNYNRKKAVSDVKSLLAQKFETIKEEYAAIEARGKNLYEDLKENIITEEEYISLKKEYADKLDSLSEEEKNITAKLSGYSENVCINKDVSADMKKWQGFQVLTREIIVAFIDRITIYSPEKIEVKYTFENLLLKMDEMIAERMMLCQNQ